MSTMARVDTTIRVMSERVSHLQLLTDVEEARNAKARAIARAAGGIAPEADCIAPAAGAIPAPVAPTAAAPEVTYWSVVFDVVTPERWLVVVDTAQRQALHGDPRAREWLTRVLGADGACQELGAADARSAVVTLGMLASEWANH